MKSKTPIDIAARALAEEKRRTLEPHPPLDELVAYRQRTLPEREQDRVQEHLSLCQECTRLLLDYGQFAGPEGAEEAAPPVDDPLVETAWEEFQRRLERQGEQTLSREASEKSEAELMEEAESRGRGDSVIPVWALTAAAGLLLALAGVSFWAVSMYQQLSEPVVASQSIYLMPNSSLTRSGDPQLALIARDPEFLTFNLGVTDFQLRPPYRAEIREASSGDLVLSIDNLKRKETGEFYFLVRRIALPPGTYTIEVSGRGDQGPEVLAKYEATLQDE